MDGFIMEKPIKMDDLGVPPIFGNIQMVEAPLAHFWYGRFFHCFFHPPTCARRLKRGAWNQVSLRRDPNFARPIGHDLG